MAGEGIVPNSEVSNAQLRRLADQLIQADYNLRNGFDPEFGGAFVPVKAAPVEDADWTPEHDDDAADRHTIVGMSGEVVEAPNVYYDLSRGGNA